MKTPFNLDLTGISGKIYKFWLYSFSEDSLEEALGEMGLFYIAKVNGDFVEQMYSLQKTSDLGSSFIEFSLKITNHEDYGFANYEGSEDIESVIADLIDNTNLTFNQLSPLNY